MNGSGKKRKRTMECSSDKRQRTMFEFFQPKQEFSSNKRQRTMFEFFQPKQCFSIPYLKSDEVKNENVTELIKAEEKHLSADSDAEDTTKVECYERNEWQLDTEETEAYDDIITAQERPCIFHCSYDDNGNLEKITCELENIFNEHGEIRTFFCPICNRRTQKGALIDHVLNHNEMKFECSEENCGWMFLAFGELRAHFMSHHNKLIRKVGKYGYRVHGEIEGNEEECDELVETNLIPCAICARGLQSQKKYEAHVENHRSMEYMYACLREGCGFMYESFHNLQCHYYSHHQSKIPKKEDFYKIARGEALPCVKPTNIDQ